MVEVFKTNVGECDEADILLYHIHNAFVDYKANFDLIDCDKILRVECLSDPIQSALIIDILNGLGYNAEVLPDEVLYI